MLGKIADIGKQVLSAVQRLQKTEEDIKALRQELREVHQDINQLRQEFGDLARVVERLAYEIQRDRDRAESERKILLLEIENRFLRQERLLPPGHSSESEPS